MVTGSFILNFLKIRTQDNTALVLVMMRDRQRPGGVLSVWRAGC